MQNRWKALGAFVLVFGAASFFLGLSPHLDDTSVYAGALGLALVAAGVIATGEHLRKP